MGYVNYTSAVGVKLLDLESGAWLCDNTITDISVTAHDMVESGTLTTAVVNTGSGLLSWSGFSISNYLSQTYEASLDFGVDSFFASCWIKAGANTLINTLFERDSAVTAQRITATLEADGTIDLTVDDGTTTRVASTTVAYDDDNWHLVHFLYDGAGGVYIYVDGSLRASTTGTALLTMTNVAATMNIGIDAQGANPAADCDITIVKIGPGTPSLAQMKLVYDSEKELFRTNTAMSVSGQAYNLTLSLTTANRAEPETSFTSKSISGVKETVLHRSDVSYTLSINRITSANLPELRAFLKSIRGRASFTFDRYGTLASPDDPRIVEADPGFQEARNGVNDYYTVSLKVNEVV